MCSTYTHQPAAGITVRRVGTSIWEGGNKKQAAVKCHGYFPSPLFLGFNPLRLLLFARRQSIFKKATGIDEVKMNFNGVDVFNFRRPVDEIFRV